MSAEEVADSTTTETPSEITAPVADGTTVQADANSNIDRDDKGKFRNPAQPRIDELTKARREAERERDYWRGRAEATAKPPEAKPEPPAKPKQDDFASYGDYVEALTDWKADQKIDAKLTERDKKSAEQQKVESRSKSWSERSRAAQAAIPDLDKVLSESDVPVAQHVTDSLLDSDLGPQIAYHLATHPEVAEKLNRMDQRQVDREIGRLEATLGTSTAAADPDPEETPATETQPREVTPARRTTQAPPPVKPVGQGRSGKVDLAKLSMDDYVKERAKQGASWAR